MYPTDRTGRQAGILYLLMGLSAPFALLYIPRTLIERGDAAATSRNIQDNLLLFEAGIAAHVAIIVLFVAVVLVLYRLLNRVDRLQASLMVALALVSVPLSLLSLLAELLALELILPRDYLATFSPTQTDALAYLLLVARGKALMIAQIFWGLWLLPFGWLVMRCGFLPRMLGVLLIVNGIAYPILSITSLFFPDYRVIVGNALFPALLGELWIMLWLAIRGAQVEPAHHGTHKVRATGIPSETR